MNSICMPKDPIYTPEMKEISSSTGKPLEEVYMDYLIKLKSQRVFDVVNSRVNPGEGRILDNEGWK